MCIYIQRAKEFLKSGTEDELFNRLFLILYSEITSPESQTELVLDTQGGRMGLHKGTRGSMAIYTCQFLRILIKILR